MALIRSNPFHIGNLSFILQSNPFHIVNLYDYRLCYRVILQSDKYGLKTRNFEFEEHITFLEPVLLCLLQEKNKYTNIM